MALRVSSLNCRSIGTTCRRAAIFKILAGYAADIYCLQDCNLREAPHTANWTLGDAVWSLGRSRNTGVGIFLKNKNIKVLRKVEVEVGRCLCVFLQYGGICFKLFCVYAPVDKKGRLDLWEKMEFFLGGRDPVIVCGILIAFCVVGIGMWVVVGILIDLGRSWVRFYVCLV